MRLRHVLVGVLGAAVLVNLIIAADILGNLGLLPGAEAGAKEEVRAPKDAPAGYAGAKEAEAAYKALVSELQAQKQTLDKKSQELAERERQVGVVRAELQAQQDQQPAQAARPGQQGSGGAQSQPGDSFKRLVKAFAGMEPENAARALAELYNRDRDTAIDLMLALPARRSGAILDALAQTKPGLAADISADMSHRDEPRAQ